MFPILDFAKWAGLAAVLAGLYASGYTKGRDSVQAEWDKERADFAITDLERALENKDAIEKLEEVKHENLKTIAALNADLKSVRVQVPVRRCPAESRKPNSTSTGADDATGTWQQPDTTQASFDNFIGILGQQAVKMDLLVEDCRVLRDWAAGLQP